ncbi:xanthine dehydrogenase family protein subunit M [Polymorphobacter sp. PAMC 29334]|uniref:FAD binding domain-containing protein n=1 Tax=Polymorphobacter sp. PAMC 29334 TaxID=2862331 RepID=UPI001C682221|nr:xanthine dehydrogenase family protein subunit M [Polymorphobacter sp. PAMC 29334]QYE35028.1 xanthine dehydrogenase family protein subunit M [Polymorphobacter sp. PAMC 29334]
MREFVYERPTTLDAAVAAFAGGGEAALIAGGHTLLPAMNSRLRQPDTLVDLAGVPGLSGITRDGDMLWIGAMTTHATVAADPTVMAAIPGLSALALLIGDPQVRNRGTIGGVLANNDPSADYPAALLALGGTVETNLGSHHADDYFQGMFATALSDGDIITRVGFKIPTASAYAKFRHPASRYAVVGVYVAKTADGVRVAVTGAGPGVVRWPEAEEALTASFTPEAAKGLVLGGDLNTDIHASAEYRGHLSGTMLARAVAAAA